MATIQEIAKAVAQEMCPTCSLMSNGCDFHNMKECMKFMVKKMDDTENGNKSL